MFEEKNTIKKIIVKYAFFVVKFYPLMRKYYIN